MTESFIVGALFAWLCFSVSRIAYSAERCADALEDMDDRGPRP